MRKDRKIYAFFFSSKDEDGNVTKQISDLTNEYPDIYTIENARQDLVSFLSQTQDSYIDKFNIIHKVTKQEDKPFAWYFEVINDCWEDVLDETGAYLDENEHPDMPKTIKAAFTKIYNLAYNHIFSEGANDGRKI